MANNTQLKDETTVVIIKPDGVKKGLIGKIISRLEERDLKIISLRMIWATRKQMDKHYPSDKKWISRLGDKTKETYKKYGLNVKQSMGTSDSYKIGCMVRGWIIDFMTSGPLVKMLVKGVHAIDMVRKLAGKSIPALAEMGTIRGDFSIDSAAIANAEKRCVYNIVHASETKKEAANELKLWFAPEEIHDYERCVDHL